jgi:iron(III) transport system substrate-binding protein
MSISPAQGAPRTAAVSRRTFAGLAASGAALIATAGAVSATTEDLSPSASPTPATPVAGANLTIYCGRNEALVGGLIEQIQATTGVILDVRYGNTAELAAQILEEGDNSPAGLYFSQDAGALGALAKAERLAPLPQDVLASVDERFRDTEGRWIGLSGRARVIVYQPDLVEESELPASILDLPESGIGPIGIAPTNASFQTFVTALRLTEGEDAARAWLEALLASDHIIFDGNGPIVDAVANSEAAVGLVNHYYLYEKQRETPDITARNHYFMNGDIGGLINIAGVGMLADSGQEPQAEAVIRYFLGEEAQQYFAEETFEYPLASGVSPSADLPPLDEYQLPPVDLNDLDDLEGTLLLLTELGMI